MTQTNTSPKDWLEGRRLRAWELKQAGWKQCDIASALGVSQGAVSQWMQRAGDGNIDALRSVSPPGAPSRLKFWQQLALMEMLVIGAEAFGFRGAVWTGRRVTALIRHHLGIGYPSRSCYAFTQTLGFHPPETVPPSPPTRRRSHRPMAGRNLAGAKKKAETEKRTLVCVDEAAFYLLPSVVRTWALRGQTPVLSEPLSRDHLSAISAITPQGQLYLQLKEGAMDGWDVVRFLCHLLRHIPGKLLILWDGASIHRGEAVRKLLDTDHHQDIWLERFPPYAPDLNPDEGIWHYLKNVELRNMCIDTLPQLRTAIHQAATRIRQKTHVITACFQKAELTL